MWKAAVAGSREKENKGRVISRCLNSYILVYKGGLF